MDIYRLIMNNPKVSMDCHSMALPSNQIDSTEKVSFSFRFFRGTIHYAIRKALRVQYEKPSVRFSQLPPATFPEK